MLDIHTHVLPGLDDGARDFDESLEIIKKYINNGYDGVIATPHHYRGRYIPSKEEIIKSRDLLLNQLKKLKIDFDIYLGNEIFFEENTINELENKEVFTIAGSRYILIEFPFLGKINYAHSLIYQIQLSGFMPIIAHVERYQVTEEEFEFMEKIYNAGALFQVNLSSLKDPSSKEYKLVNKILDRDMVQFVATDTHSLNKRNPDVKDELNYLKNKMGERWYQEVVIDNPYKVINGEFVRKTEIKESLEKNKKKSFFEKIFRRN